MCIAVNGFALTLGFKVDVCECRLLFSILTVCIQLNGKRSAYHMGNFHMTDRLGHVDNVLNENADAFNH